MWRSVGMAAGVMGDDPGRISGSQPKEISGGLPAFPALGSTPTVGLGAA